MADAVSAAAPIVSSSLSTPEATGLGALDGDTFLQLMVAQLRYQNPFEPMDSSEMMQQTAALTTVETLQQLASSQQLLMGLQEASMAASMIGKEVTAQGVDGEVITGIVTEVVFTSDGPLLRLDGDQEVPIGDVLSMTVPEPVEADASEPDAAADPADTGPTDP